MRKCLFIVIALFSLNLAFADKLILINYKNSKELKNLVANKELRINYYSDNIVIATAKDSFDGDYTVLDNNSWDGRDYYISWFHKGVKGEYLSQVAGVAEILLETDSFLFLKAYSGATIHPPTDGRVTRITNEEIKLPQKKFNYTGGSIKNDPEIEAMMNEVDMEIYVQNLQHLQDYGTRNAYTPQSIQAQNWIKEQFESYGYTVELFDFTMPQPASDNVIATKLGTTYPDEYVVIGGHYDSYACSVMHRVLMMMPQEFAA